MNCPNCQREIKTNGRQKYYACKCGVSLSLEGGQLVIFKTRPVWGGSRTRGITEAEKIAHKADYAVGFFVAFRLSNT